MLYIHGLGHFHPENVISNAFLEGLDIGTDDAWIVERTGIRNRRTVLHLDYIQQTRNADIRAAAEASMYDDGETGARAARLALARAGVTADQIGLVISGGSVGDLAPVVAARVAAKLGIAAPVIDLSSACSTFAVQIHFLASMRPEALPDFVLIVQAENTTRHVSYKDRASCVLWGDGTAAAVVSARVPGRMALDLTSVASDPSSCDKACIPHAGFFVQDGRAVQTFAIKKTRDLVNGVRANVADPSRLHFVGHQANLLVLEAVVRYAAVAPERHHTNVIEHGNTGAAGAPSVLSQRWDEWQVGDEIAVAVVGAGLTWSGMRITVGEVS